MTETVDIMKTSTKRGRESTHATKLMTASLKNGTHKTMYFVSRHVVNNAAVHIDEYLPKGSYAGEWKGDVRDGLGCQIYSNGDRYEGGWRGGLREGRGTYWKRHKLQHTAIGSHTTTGAGKEGPSAGKGTAASGKLVKYYEGDYYADKRHGSGRLFLDNGDV